jgi:hypothetical protein
VGDATVTLMNLLHDPNLSKGEEIPVDPEKRAEYFKKLDPRFQLSRPPQGKFRPSYQIPKKYEQPAASGLTCKVRPGSQTFDINLSP